MKIPSIDEILALSGSMHKNSRAGISIHGYQRAGVLVPIVTSAAGPSLLFTKRTSSVETHKGQISFPGGVVDQADGSIEETALRESEEEIGLSRSNVSVIGLLDDVATPTGFVITPVVGVIRQLPAISVNPNEVEDVFYVPLSFFADEGNGRVETREVNGKERQVWFYETEGHTIWGATAHIVRSLLMEIGRQ